MSAVRLARASFRELVVQAVQLRRELVQPVKYGDIRDQRMTKRAALAEALRNARCDAARIEQVRRIIGEASRQPDSTRAISAFVSEVRRKMSVTHEYQGACDRPPSAGLDNIFLNAAGFTALLSECVSFDVTPHELVALATADTPEEGFGVLTDIDAHCADIERKQRRLRELCVEAAAAVELSDFRFDAEGSNPASGIFRRRFAMADVVASEPLPAAVERLVQALAVQSSERS